MAFSVVQTAPTSPLMIADRLLTMAEETDRAGYTDVAAQLLTLVYDVLERPANLH